MSSPDSNGTGGPVSLRQAFEPQPNNELNIDPDLESCMLNTDSNIGSKNFVQPQHSQGVARSAVGGYGNNATSGHSGNMQSNNRFDPPTPTPMKRQHTSSISTPFTTPQKPKYDSPNIQNSADVPSTPRQYNYKNHVSANVNPSFQTNSTPNMAQSPFNMTAGSPIPYMPNFNNVLNSESPHVRQNLMNMNTISQQQRGPQSFNEATGTLNSQSGQDSQSLTSTAMMPQQHRGSQSSSSQNRLYGSNDNGFGAGFFASENGFDLAALEDQEQVWNMLGNCEQQGFGGGQSVNQEELEFGNGELFFANAQYPSPHTLANQAVANQFGRNSAADYEDEVEEHDSESEAEEDSDYGDDKGTPSTSHTASSSSRSGPRNNVSKYQAIIKSEGDYKELLEKRAKTEQESVSRNRRDTCPTNDKKILEYIGELFDAIMNTDGIVDKKAQDGRKAQAARRLDDNYYSAEVVEIACWEIFGKCRDAAKGIRLVDPYHKTKREGNDCHETFKKRWDAIIDACKHSKAVCKQVLDPLYVDRLVDAPKAQYQMKLNNKKINAERDKQNKLGRIAIRNGVSLNDIPGMVQEEEVKQNEDAVITPSKRRSRQRDSAAKRRTPKQVKYEYSDEEGEGGDLTYETPIKKERAGTMTVSSRHIRTPHKSTPRKANPSSSTKAEKSSDYPPSTRQLDMEYRLAICELLQLNPEFANQFTLEQLRVFARPYNFEQLKDPWYHESFTKGQRGLGHQLFHANGNLIPHFTWKLRDLQALAVARGELEVTGHLIPDHRVQYYTIGDNTELKQILGITFNSFNWIVFNQPPPQEAHSS